MASPGSRGRGRAGERHVACSGAGAASRSPNRCFEPGEQVALDRKARGRRGPHRLGRVPWRPGPAAARAGACRQRPRRLRGARPRAPAQARLLRGDREPRPKPRRSAPVEPVERRDLTGLATFTVDPGHGPRLRRRGLGRGRGRFGPALDPHRRRRGLRQAGIKSRSSRMGAGQQRLRPDIGRADAAEGAERRGLLALSR